MVEQQIEFYFSKHPHIELDCGWSRKGSSNTERSLFMAKSTHFTRQEAERFSTIIRCNYRSDVYSTALCIERALAKGLIYVRVHFEYLDRSDESFNEDEWIREVLDFNDFESLVDYLIHEFNCVKIEDVKPLAHKPCFHTADVVFTRQEGTL